MPLYEYECTKCGERTEAIQRHGDALLSVCPACGGALVKLLSAPAFQFKGSGFYVTDYGKSGSAGDRAAEKSEERKEKEKSSSKGEEGKPSGATSGGAAPGTGAADSSKGKKAGDAGGASNAAASSPAGESSPAPSKKTPKSPGDTK